MSNAEFSSEHTTEAEYPPPTGERETPIRWVVCTLWAVLTISAVMSLTLVVSNAPATLAESLPDPQKPRRASDLGFDLGQKVGIPRDEIHAGGPGKDGIPSLDSPKFIAAKEAGWLKPEDRIVGVERAGKARAYPLRILVWHEVVNDTIGDEPLAVTYCPLCDSVAAFDRRTPSGGKKFGVSGLLYNSNVLMFDRGGKPEGLWSQIKGQAVSGPPSGQALRTLPVELTTWADWRARHPETSVLSSETGFRRDYSRDPYAGYFDRPGLVFPAKPKSDRLPEKSRVLGVWVADGTAKAYPLKAFANSREPVEFQDRIAERSLTLRYDPASKSLRIVKADEGVQWMYSLWFAWYAFHPETKLYELPVNNR